jgi:hypothetical protein
MAAPRAAQPVSQGPEQRGAFTGRKTAVCDAAEERALGKSTRVHV